MKTLSASEKLLIEEISSASRHVQIAIRGLPIGQLIKLIRTQLGMSQKVLAVRARIPQSTVSRVENGQKDINLSTLQKLLDALVCDLIIAPALREPIEMLKRKQASKIAEKQVRYLKGTMNLEEQQPDPRFIEELLKQQEDELLRGSPAKLWEE